jgi:hypothetical protein
MTRTVEEARAAAGDWYRSRCPGGPGHEYDPKDEGTRWQKGDCHGCIIDALSAVPAHDDKGAEAVCPACEATAKRVGPVKCESCGAVTYGEAALAVADEWFKKGRAASSSGEATALREAAKRVLVRHRDVVDGTPCGCDDCRILRRALAAPSQETETRCAETISPGAETMTLSPETIGPTGQVRHSAGCVSRASATVVYLRDGTKVCGRDLRVEAQAVVTLAAPAAPRDPGVRCLKCGSPDYMTLECIPPIDVCCQCMTPWPEAARNETETCTACGHPEAAHLDATAPHRRCERDGCLCPDLAALPAPAPAPSAAPDTGKEPTND